MADPLANVQIADRCCCGSRAHRGHSCQLGDEGARRVRTYLAENEGDDMIDDGQEIWDAAYGPEYGCGPIIVGCLVGFALGASIMGALVWWLT